MAEPAVVVRSLEEARRVVEAAARLGADVALVNEPGAQGWLGPAYLLAMMRQAGAPRAVIDCGPDAGTAMAALRVGWREIHATGRADTVRRLAEMTEAAGGRFHARLGPCFVPPEGGPVDEPLRAWLAACRSN